MPVVLAGQPFWQLVMLLTQVHAVPTSPSPAQWNPIADLHARITVAGTIGADHQRWLWSPCE